MGQGNAQEAEWPHVAGARVGGAQEGSGGLAEAGAEETLCSSPGAQSWPGPAAALPLIAAGLQVSF